MSPRYQAVIFDVDGTLLDATEGISAAVLQTIVDLKLAPCSAAELRSFIGPPVQESFIRVYGMSKEEAQGAAEIFRDYYKNRELFRASPYPGMLELMERLSAAGIPQGIATFKRHDYAVLLAEHFGFSRHATAVFGADGQNQLTKADIIELAMKELGVTERERVVYVGDMASDAKASEKLGIRFAAVLFGFGFAQPEDVQTWPHLGCARTAEELSSLLLG